MLKTNNQQPTHMKTTLVTVGKRGTIVIPSTLRKQFHVQEGDLLITKEHEGGILITPAVAMPLETYSSEQKAEFLLSTATDPQDYKKARQAVKKLGINPDTIKHFKPKFP